jgi:hypothetical protein
VVNRRWHGDAIECMEERPASFRPWAMMQSLGNLAAAMQSAGQEWHQVCQTWAKALRAMLVPQAQYTSKLEELEELLGQEGGQEVALQMLRLAAEVIRVVAAADLDRAAGFLYVATTLQRVRRTGRLC